MRTPAFICILLTCASLFLLSARTAPEAFEYKIVPVRTYAEGAEEPRNPIEAADAEANKMAAAGWELTDTELVFWDDAVLNSRDLTVVLTFRKQK